jgi:hypothetical protein
MPATFSRRTMPIWPNSRSQAEPGNEENAEDAAESEVVP